MSNIKKNRNFKKWLSEIKDGSLQIVANSIQCKLCNKFIGCSRKSQLMQHISTKFHKKGERINQQDHAASPDNFNFDLCQAIVAVNIPWHALSNTTFKSFLEKYTKRVIPDESPIRKNYLNQVYEQTIENIRLDIGDEYIWIAVDETTDSTGRYVANFVVGKLCENEPSSPHLLCCSELVRADSETIARFVNCSVLKLWPNGTNAEKVLLLLTDAAPYMVKAAKQLKVFYENLKHLTCLAHGLHRVAEKIRLLFPNVNDFISAIKKVFLKSPTRIALYKEITNNAPLPPNPVITRWGTWINAALFHAENFNKIKEVIEALTSDAECVDTVKNAIKNQSLLTSLLFIKTHFANLPLSIKKLEEQRMKLAESIGVVTEFEKSLGNVPGDHGINIREKLQMTIAKNPVFFELKQLASILDSPLREHTDVSINHKFSMKFNYAPITSCEVERTFSAYKFILNDKRRRLSIENLEKIIITYCNTGFE